MKEKILVVGDLHGDWGRLNILIQKKQPDIVLQCGDFGWWPAMEVQRPVLYGRQRTWTLRGVKPGCAKVYFCDGNHEQHPELIQDGGVHEMYENVFHCSRGSVLRLPGGRIVMFVGGANSIDKGQRTPGHDWFPDENITPMEFSHASKFPGRVDVVISHTCPESFDIVGTEGKTVDPNRKALDYLLEKHRPALWYFGHWHKSQKGVESSTRWECLDYPGHGGKWWVWLP